MKEKVRILIEQLDDETCITEVHGEEFAILEAIYGFLVSHAKHCSSNWILITVLKMVIEDIKKEDKA